MQSEPAPEPEPEPAGSRRSRGSSAAAAAALSHDSTALSTEASAEPGGRGGSRQPLVLRLAELSEPPGGTSAQTSSVSAVCVWGGVCVVRGRGWIKSLLKTKDKHWRPIYSRLDGADGSGKDTR